MFSLPRLVCVAATIVLLTGGIRIANADGDGSTDMPTTAAGNGGDRLDRIVEDWYRTPNSPTAERALEDYVTAGLGDRISPGSLAALPVTTVTLPDGLGMFVVPKPYLPTPSSEPQYGWSFSKVSYLYLERQGELIRFCTVHYTLPEDAPFAKRVAGLLALAYRSLTDKTGRPPANGDQPFDVWLCRGGHSGGEQWRSNLYFYDLDTPRSSIEWIREIVHEYSHLALPAIGGYQKPEYWANGYLGERLIVRWLQRSPRDTAAVNDVWGDFSGVVNFDRLLIDPAIATYEKIGPSAAWLARTDADGMRYFIGQALVLDDKYGSVVLGDLFSELPRFHEAHPADLIAGLSSLPLNRQARSSSDHQ